MADTNEWYYDRPNWAETGNAAQLAVRAIRRTQLWLFGEIWYKPGGVKAQVLPGHTTTDAGGGEPAWVNIADNSGSGYQWRANLTWSGGRIISKSLQFDDGSGGGFVNYTAPKLTILAADDTDANSFFWAPAPTDPRTTCDAIAKAFRESYLCIAALAPLDGDYYESHQRLTGFTPTVTGDISQPSQIDLDGGDATKPNIRYTYQYRSDNKLWRLRVQTRRKDSEPFYELDHWEYQYDQDGRLAVLRSVASTAPGFVPQPRLGLELATASFTPDNNSNGEMYDWTVPADATTTLITPGIMMPSLLNHWWLMAVLGYGGASPLYYRMPRMTTGHGAVLFFYADNSDGDAGRPAAVEMIQGNLVVRYENTYTAGVLTGTKWYCDMSCGAGWFKIGEI